MSLGIVAIASTLLSACAIRGNGRVESESRSLPAFDSIHLRSMGKLIVRRGPRELKLRCDSNILPYVQAEVEGGLLKIGLKSFAGLRLPTLLEFEVRVPELSILRLSGSGDALVEAFAGDSFEANLSGSGGIKAVLDYRRIKLVSSGSGRLEAELDADDLELRGSGSGEVTLKGRAGKAQLTISGSGSLGARDLAVGEASVKISGSGDVEMRADRKMDIAISGSGSIGYWGNPSVKQRVSGTGSLRRLGD
jgi:hypothetical protein